MPSARAPASASAPSRAPAGDDGQRQEPTTGASQPAAPTPPAGAVNGDEVEGVLRRLREAGVSARDVELLVAATRLIKEHAAPHPPDAPSTSGATQQQQQQQRGGPAPSASAQCQTEPTHTADAGALTDATPTASARCQTDPPPSSAGAGTMTDEQQSPARPSVGTSTDATPSASARCQTDPPPSSASAGTMTDEQHQPPAEPTVSTSTDAACQTTDPADGPGPGAHEQQHHSSSPSPSSLAPAAAAAAAAATLPPHGEEPGASPTHPPWPGRDAAPDAEQHSPTRRLPGTPQLLHPAHPHHHLEALEPFGPSPLLSPEWRATHSSTTPPPTVAGLMAERDALQATVLQLQEDLANLEQVRHALCLSPAPLSKAVRLLALSLSSRPFWRRGWRAGGLQLCWRPPSTRPTQPALP